jgi:hypothetical protein
MKKYIFILVIGCLFLIPALTQAQLDKVLDRFLQKDQKEERIRSEDLRIVELEFSPDPIREGQRVSFQITINNNSRHSGRMTLIIKDRDEVISEGRDVYVNPGENRIEFPLMDYRFSRSDYCFTVEADIERNRRPIDMAKEFCAQRTRSGWTMRGRETFALYVEDLDMNPDPAIPGQDVRFRVKLRNDGRPIRGTIRIQDKDQVVVQVENVSIPRGYSDFQFPYMRYSFQRFDHCFTVVVDSERTLYPVDAAREFCAKPMGWTLQPTPETTRGGPAQFDIGFFYDELAPYGEWFQLERYGWVWTPYNLPFGWRPYTDGRWVYTDDGWTWASDWEWGWAPFHYGRWLFDDQYGWVWVPGRVWAPAWVAWRSGPGWIGWAPLPPGVGVESKVSFEDSIRPLSWCFVEDRGFLETNLRGSVLPPARNVTIIRMTQNVTNYTLVQNRVVNKSLTVDQVERVVQKPVSRYRIVDRDAVPAQKENFRGNEVYMFRRTLTEAPAGRSPKKEGGPKRAPEPGTKPGAVSAAPKPITMPELLRRQEGERRELFDYQQNQRTRIEKEHLREIQQPPKGKSMGDLRKEHDVEMRDLEVNSQQERQLLQRRHERERNTIDVR